MHVYTLGSKLKVEAMYYTSTFPSMMKVFSKLMIMMSCSFCAASSKLLCTYNYVVSTYTHYYLCVNEQEHACIIMSVCIYVTKSAKPVLSPYFVF